MPHKKIAIIGESCIDEYVFGTCERVCPEAAALCFKRTGDIRSNSGMAGNVYNNLLSIIDDTCELQLICPDSQIIKRRFVDKKYNTIIFREDINDECTQIDLSVVDFSIYDYLVFSDYCKGFLSEDDIENICNKKSKTCVTFLDTKKKISKKLTNIIDFIKINTEEFNKNISSINDINHKCYLIVTQGENGAILYHNKTQKKFPTNKVILRDVCGAGDTFMAGLVWNYIQSSNIHKAIIYANECASHVVSQFGVVTV